MNAKESERELSGVASVYEGFLDEMNIIGEEAHDPMKPFYSADFANELNKVITQLNKSLPSDRKLKLIDVEQFSSADFANYANQVRAALSDVNDELEG